MVSRICEPSTQYFVAAKKVWLDVPWSQSSDQGSMMCSDEWLLLSHGNESKTSRVQSCLFEFSKTFLQWVATIFNDFGVAVWISKNIWYILIYIYIHRNKLIHEQMMHFLKRTRGEYEYISSNASHLSAGTWSSCCSELWRKYDRRQGSSCEPQSSWQRWSVMFLAFSDVKMHFPRHPVIFSNDDWGVQSPPQHSIQVPWIHSQVRWSDP